MHRDTRHLTVALDHLRAAYDELTLAQGNPERSVEEAAVRRALDHLNLAVRRLEFEPERQERDKAAELIRRSYDSARAAWHEVHTILNDWPDRAPEAIDHSRTHVTEAVELLEQAIETALATGVMEP